MSGGTDLALLASSLGLGLRHGLDWDHIAAISDLTGASADRRRSMALATVYAAGHASVVLALGSVALLVGDVLPEGVDELMGRVVGLTLIVLGGFIALGLLRDRRGFRMRSRWMAVAALVRMVSRRVARGAEVVIEHDHAHGPNHGHDHLAVDPLDADHHRGHLTTATDHRHRHVHRASLPPDPFGPTPVTVFGVGMLHGIGAETPTQLLLFVAAASVDGALAGHLLLLSFTVGLVISNTIIAVAATAGFLRADRHPHIHVALSVMTAVFSLVLGSLYLLGIDALAPLTSG